MATVTEFPTNWHELVADALTKARHDNPTKAVWGVSLPESWMSELQYYARNGELSRMFGVRAVSFSGKTIGTFDAPAPKEAPKSKKAG